MTYYNVDNAPSPSVYKQIVEESIQPIRMQIKRLLDDTASSNNSSSSKRNATEQKLFRNRLLEVENKCPITGSSESSCDAAHIFKHSSWRHDNVCFFYS